MQGSRGGNSLVSSLQVRRLGGPTSVGVVGCAAGAKRWKLESVVERVVDGGRVMCLCVCVFLCVCVREREREHV